MIKDVVKEFLHALLNDVLPGINFGKVVHSDFDACLTELPEFLKGIYMRLERVALFQRIRNLIEENLEEHFVTIFFIPMTEQQLQKVDTKNFES